jgi:hypothetical protein
MMMMKYIPQFAAFMLFSILLCGGCTPEAPHDTPVQEALEAFLQSDEFTQEERDAVASIKVHNDNCWVWLKKGFSNDEEVITSTAKHIGDEFAEEFHQTAMKHNYKAPRYNVQIWMKITTDKGTHKAYIYLAYWDLQKARLYREAYGLAKFKGIK